VAVAAVGCSVIYIIAVAGSAVVRLVNRSCSWSPDTVMAGAALRYIHHTVFDDDGTFKGWVMAQITVVVVYGGQLGGICSLVCCVAGSAIYLRGGLVGSNCMVVVNAYMAAVAAKSGAVCIGA